MRDGEISSDLTPVVGLSVWILGLQLAFGLNAANACSVELHSITRIFESSHRVIVGVVESVEVDSPELVDDDSYQLTLEASLRVEHTLKGDPDPELVQLSFPPENSCSGFYDGYGLGDRFILMLSEPDDAGVYRARSIPPFRLRLPSHDGYTETLLYRYIEGLATEGQPPVSIDFGGQKQQTTGHRLDAGITITKALPSTLTVRVSNAHGEA
jgi:hypothetical protein